MTAKPRLIILSDLWGITPSDNWLSYYTQNLSPVFDITSYDSCVLGEIDLSIDSEKNRHRQFIEKGINQAQKNLLQLEKEPITVLGFSIGGLIGWQAALKGLNVHQLYPVSSTRLRYETRKPACQIIPFFGTDDTYAPRTEWYTQFNLVPNLFHNKAHTFYREKDCATQICRTILEKHT